ncbi:MAG: Ldh family oxidoreductase [Hyphomicrobiales bacterium]|nr:Ldh family oxidoreductase [Hyphomicrobiales bacterium]
MTAHEIRPLAVEPLRDFTLRTLRRFGCYEREAAVVAGHLVGANLCGHDSHGVGMLPFYARSIQASKLRPGAEAKLIKSQDGILQFDGQRGFGQFVVHDALMAAFEQRRKSNLVMVTVANSGHMGRIGTYGEMAAAKGFVFVGFVSVLDLEPVVAPFGAKAARLSTNPVCIAIPGSDGNTCFMLDMATSAVAMGKVRVARDEGKKFKGKPLIDSQGCETDDPACLYETPRGAIRSAGEHKGYALAVACELLAGALSGAGPFLGGVVPDSLVNNATFFLIDAQTLGILPELGRSNESLSAYLRMSPPIDENNPVKYPNDPEIEMREVRTRIGIPLAKDTLNQLQEMANSLGIEATELAMASPL